MSLHLKTQTGIVKKYNEFIKETVSEINHVEIKSGDDTELQTLITGLTVDAYKRKTLVVRPILYSGVIGLKDDTSMLHALEITMSNKDILTVEYSSTANSSYTEFTINKEEVISRNTKQTFTDFIKNVITHYRIYLEESGYRILDNFKEAVKSDGVDMYDLDGGKITDPENWEIETILAITTNPNEVVLQNNTIKDITNVKEGSMPVPLQTNLQVTSVARGQTLYITAFLKSNSASTAYTPGTLGVLKVRVVDIFYNLSALRYAK